MTNERFSLEVWSEPGKEFRSAPFWSWNGRLDEAELRRQIRTFKNMGMGGFFMHSRIGLATPYLSSEWFELINACIDEAKKLGMDAWLYDEDRWPSGYAGGLVTQTPEYRMKLIYLTEIKFEECGGYALPETVVALFAAKVNGNSASGVRKITHPDEVRPTETMLLFTLKTAPLTNWFNGGCYLDPMNPAAVRRFIELTHEAYLKNCGSEFGRNVPGIFTDEPQYGFIVTQLEWAGETAYSTPYNPQIRERIRTRHGYDIFEHLTDLFFDIEEMDFHIVRLHYVGAVTELFIENYARPIGEWCKQHCLCYTGHVMGEDSLAWQTWNSGSPMRFYRHMGMPGIDVLSECESNYFTARLLSSAGRQFGKTFRLAELYGCTGWDFPPSGHKAIGDWLIAHGVNFRCQHLAHYTLAGEGKRDYPASISYHLSWHQDYVYLENYFARINAALHNGRELCDILLLLPVESAWCFIRKDFLTDIDMLEFDRQYAELNKELARRMLEFDLGDEDIIATDGQVESEELKVGQASYHAIVVPPMLTMRESTLRILEEFHASGGVIVFTAPPPKRVDGKIDSRPAELARQCQNAGLDSLMQFQRVSLDAGNGEILCHLRSEPTVEWLFVVNTGCVPGREDDLKPWAVQPVKERNIEFPTLNIDWRTEKDGRIYECDPETGNICVGDAEKLPEGWRIRTSLPCLGSRLFALTCEDWKTVPRSQTVSANAEQVELPINFNYTTDSLNVLVFDHFRYRLDGSDWSERLEYVLLLDENVRQMLNIPIRSSNMVQPWFGGISGRGTVELELDAEFQCEALPKGKLFLALENPELFTFSINDITVNTPPRGWIIDRAIQMIELPANSLRIGENTLRLVAKYDCTHPGLEAIYLCGNFGVKVEGVTGRLITRPQYLSYGSWTGQGFPFYPGNITYRTNIMRCSSRPYWLKLPDFCGALCRVKVDGRLLRVLMWSPYELDLSSIVPENKEVMLELEIAGSPRNMLGPFFDRERKLRFCMPDHFKEYSGCPRKLADYGFTQ